MTQDEAIAVVQKIIQGHEDVAPSEYTLDTELFALGADSLDVVEMSMVVEDKYEVEFSSKMLNGIKTVGDLVRAVMQVVPSQVQVQ